jgi:hypothetical protein
VLETHHILSAIETFEKNDRQTAGAQPKASADSKAQLQQLYNLLQQQSPSFPEALSI